MWSINKISGYNFKVLFRPLNFVTLKMELYFIDLDTQLWHFNDANWPLEKLYGKTDYWIEDASCVKFWNNAHLKNPVFTYCKLNFISAQRVSLFIFVWEFNVRNALAECNNKDREYWERPRHTERHNGGGEQRWWWWCEEHQRKQTLTKMSKYENLMKVLRLKLRKLFQ